VNGKRSKRLPGGLLSQHLVDGRDAVAVIDELEALYAAAFGEFAAGNGA